jgi:preprotein translocase SecE subunit
MGGLIQYFKDTRAELHHVAWPTQAQTIIYTLLVAVLSVGIAFYLGLFDFLFTTALSKVVNNLPATNAAITQPVATSTATTTISTNPLQIATTTKK